MLPLQKPLRIVCGVEVVEEAPYSYAAKVDDQGSVVRVGALAAVDEVCHPSDTMILIGVRVRDHSNGDDDHTVTTLTSHYFVLVSVRTEL